MEPDGIDRVLATLSRWEPIGGCADWLQAGDIGWMLRLGRQRTASSLLEWTTPSGETGAIMCHDGGDSWRFATDPVLFGDRDLAASIADWADEVQPAKALTIDGPSVPAVWRQVLAERGFEASNDAWAHLWKPLGLGDIVDIPEVEMTDTEQAIADRVAVQKAAFANSTFTVDKWHEMANGPTLRPELDLLARDKRGNPVAALTAWLPGEGKCGMLEPMGTHPDFRRMGHGKRVIQAAFAALARAGAASVCVVTPESNVAAVELYRSAGFRRIGLMSGTVRGGEDNAFGVERPGNRPCDVP
jgi:ribosomal protein S18 acetylase RimI-like enzyme